MSTLPPRFPLYIYLDEGGNLDFSPTGTRFFVMTTVTCLGPHDWVNGLNEIKAKLAEGGLELPYFHASEDKQPVRNRVFQLITDNLNQFWIDSLIVEKAKTGPALQEPIQFYSRMVGYLLKWRMRNLNPLKVEKTVVITDRLPSTQRRTRALERAIKEELSKPSALHAMWGPIKIPYEVVHDSCDKHPGLQIADYCNWAIYRKWTNADVRSYDLIKRGIKSEFDIFRTGTRLYY